jgi:hypothetical protein
MSRKIELVTVWAPNDAKDINMTFTQYYYDFLQLQNQKIEEIEGVGKVQKM